MLTRLRARASRADTSACLDLLLEYIAWYDDPHLFLYQSAKLDSVESRRRMAAVKAQPFDSLAFMARLHVAVIPDSGPGTGRFVGLVLTPDTISWPRGAVRARFRRIESGKYAANLDLPPSPPTSIGGSSAIRPSPATTTCRWAGCGDTVSHRRCASISPTPPIRSGGWNVT